MRAAQFSEYGGPEVLAVGEAPEPHAGPGQVRIRVKAASVNPIDWKLRAGFLAQDRTIATPLIPGYDAAGYVDEVGDGVTDAQVGDEVFGLGSSTYAEFAVLDAWAPKHPSLDWAVAAAAGVAGETAVRGLDLLGVGTGTTVFVDGGSGGVGAVAVQVAKARGAVVIASASEANADYLREIGATPVAYGDGVVDRVRAAAGSDQVDAVLDIAGKTPIADLISLAPEPAQVVTIANFGAAESGARVTSSGGAERAARLEEIAVLLQRNDLVIKVQTFPLDRAAETHRTSESGHARGKIVLLP